MTRPMTRLLPILAILLFAGSVPPAAQEIAPDADAATDPATRLHDLFDREWEWRLQDNPLLATNVGRHEWNDRLPSMSQSAELRRTEMRLRFIEELEQIDRAQLGNADRISYDIFLGQLHGAVLEFKYGENFMPINADSGFHSSFARLPTRVPLATVEDYENYISRLGQFERYAGQQIHLMRAGIDRGITLPRIVLDGVADTISAHVVDDPEESLLYEPFVELPTTVPASEHERLRAAGREAIRDSVVPGYRAFHQFMVDEYLPGARTTLGATDLPNGDEYYQARIRHFTTLDLTPDEIHQIGLDEVARIRGEMEAIIDKVGFEGSFDEFLEFLRTDPRFYPETGQELLERASYIAKRMDGKLPSLFKTLPRLPYGVAPVPDHIAPKYTAGRYVGPPLGSTEPGWYWVNTYALDSRTLYTLEALTLHEAVPGHHLQGSLSREQEGLPSFRRFSYISAFGEGWGLYSEWLGLEAGFYTDPYSDFGRLTYEMWRACRLVVDTGVHALGWSRDQMREYMAANTALSLHEIATETDRYISWPAQAL
ncbi:MAG: DUF885 domain-containing protein, partial [Thermoanaerobaculia bacterium]|nr:DUF885 domain-containing protein [Thermoanaerobaculia bacterium]